MNTSSLLGCTAGAPAARYGLWTCDLKVSEIFADTSRNRVRRLAEIITDIAPVV